MRAVCPCFGFSPLNDVSLLTKLYSERRGSLLFVELLHAGFYVAFTSDVSSPVVINTAGAHITLWCIAVVLIVASLDCLH